MKYKIIYNENHVSENCKVCFGKFYNNWTFTTYYYGKFCYIKNEKYDAKDLSYGEVREHVFFKDVLTLGKELYRLFKDNLKPIFQNGAYMEITGDFVSNKDINKNIEKVIPLCLDFVSQYNIPIYSLERNNSEYLEDSISVHELVNNAIMIYILNFAYSDLCVHYEENEALYKSLEIDSDDGDYYILIKIVSFLDNIFGRASLGRYKTDVTRNWDEDKIIPIRYVTNLFTFAYETLINNIASYVTYDKDYNEEMHTWKAYTKCHRCLATLSKEVKVSTDYEPAFNKLLCEECKKVNRHKSVMNYERTKREIYDYLKKNIHRSKNNDLINEVNSLKPKDKEGKKHLKSLKQMLDAEISKTDRT